MAGVLLAYRDHDVIAKAYGVENSIIIFLFCVIGGLTSVPWAVWGVVTAEAGVLFLPRAYQHLGATATALIPLLLTGPLLVVNLYFYPGGTAEWGFERRDRFLRWVARRHDVVVPSLVVDRSMGFEEAERKIVEAAEEHVEATETFDIHGGVRTVECPTCGLVLTLDEAADHDHLRVGATKR
jgi:hypothetical protein